MMTRLDPNTQSLAAWLGACGGGALTCDLGPDVAPAPSTVSRCRDREAHSARCVRVITIMGCHPLSRRGYPSPHSTTGMSRRSPNSITTRNPLLSGQLAWKNPSFLPYGKFELGPLLVMTRKSTFGTPAAHERYYMWGIHVISCDTCIMWYMPYITYCVYHYVTYLFIYSEYDTWKNVITLKICVFHINILLNILAWDMGKICSVSYR